MPGCRDEYVRLLEQALRALGYHGVARQLEAESGVAQQPAQAAAFRAAVLRGDYDAALQVGGAGMARDAQQCAAAGGAGPQAGKPGVQCALPLQTLLARPAALLPRSSCRRWQRLVNPLAARGCCC